MKCQQRKLLFEWLQFLIVDLVIGVLLLMKCSRKLIVIMLDALLSSQWRNNCAELPSKLSLASSSSSSLQMIYPENWNIDDDDDDDHTVAFDATTATTTETKPNDNFTKFSRASIDDTKVATYQLCCSCARISNCTEHRLLELVSEHNEQKMILPMPQIASTSHQYFYETCRFNCKSCQTKLFTSVDSLNQMHRPMNANTEIGTHFSHNV